MDQLRRLTFWLGTLVSFSLAMLLLGKGSVIASTWGQVVLYNLRLDNLAETSVIPVLVTALLTTWPMVIERLRGRAVLANILFLLSFLAVDLAGISIPLYRSPSILLTAIALPSLCIGMAAMYVLQWSSRLFSSYGIVSGAALGAATAIVALLPFSLLALFLASAGPRG